MWDPSAEDRSCKGQLELFWSDLAADRESRAAQLERARQLCRGCPHRQPCLLLGIREYAHRGDAVECESVWGGEIFPDEFRAQRRLAARSRLAS